jgi:parvulin-like peptidyl-prolyl isomerase
MVLILAAGYVVEVVMRGQETVAEVHGERITAAALVEAARPEYQAMVHQAEQLRQRGFGDQAGQLRSQLPLLPQQVLNQEVQRKLIQREAQQRGLGVSESEVQQELRERMQLEAAASNAETQPEAEPTPLSDTDVDSTYREFLRRVGVDDAFYRRILREQVLTEKVQNALGAQVPKAGEQVHARHILVADEPKANDLLARLQAGESFEELAKVESTDPGSKEAGGDLGWFPRGIMNSAFESAVFAAAPGSGPSIVRSPNGWHIIEVLEKSSERPLDAPDQENLEARAFQEWLTAARQAPEVKVDLSPRSSDWVVRRLQARIF